MEWRSFECERCYPPGGRVGVGDDAGQRSGETRELRGDPVAHIEQTGVMQLNRRHTAGWTYTPAGTDQTAVRATGLEKKAYTWRWTRERGGATGQELE